MFVSATGKHKGNSTDVISGPPVDVGVTMYVLSISSLSEVKMVLNTVKVLKVVRHL